MKPESRPSSEQGLESAVNLAGPLITSSSRHPPAKHASSSGSLVAEVYSLLHLKRLFDSAGLPTIKPRDSALRAVTKEVGGRSRNRLYPSIPCTIPPPPFCTRAVCRLRWPRPCSGTTVRRSTKSTSRSGSRPLKKLPIRCQMC